MTDAEIKDTLVTFQTGQGLGMRASLLRVTRYEAVFETYSAGAVIRVSDVLEGFRVMSGERVVYSGRALVSNVLNTGTMLVCEVKLDEAGLAITPLGLPALSNGALCSAFEGFLAEWQKLYRVRTEFKETIGDLQSYWSDLRVWLEQVELEIRSSPAGDRQDLERQVVDQLAGPVIRSIDSMIERVEEIAEDLRPEERAAHRAYLRRQLHPLLLSSPFAFRAYQKPLGYAGDYEMVDMMMRPPHEGSTLFAKMMNVWLLSQTPVVAHRNRLEYLERRLLDEAVRMAATGRSARVYNLGCGPAVELQRFIRTQSVASGMSFTLLDFNEETLAHARARLESARQAGRRTVQFEFVQRSVQHLLREAARSVQRPAGDLFDFIYCGGLFDYLPDGICRRLMTVLYEWLAPGGLLLTTNVSDAMNRSHPFRHSMDYMLDWHLIYRNGEGFLAVRPEQAPADAARVMTEDTGANLFLEVRKPSHA